MCRQKTLYILLFGFLAITPLQSHSQLRQGHFIIEPYYGFPNFMQLAGKLASNGIENLINDNIDDFTSEYVSLNADVGFQVTGLGPMGGRLEYVLIERLAVGVDVIYNHAAAKFAVDSVDINQLPVETFDITYTMRRIRAMVKVNYHFVNSKMWDVYCGLGFGYNNRLHTIDANGIFNWDFSQTLSFAYPICARTCIGARFYPVQYVGLGIELGLGGPIVSGGLSARFNPFNFEDKSSNSRIDVNF